MQRRATLSVRYTYKSYLAHSLDNTLTSYNRAYQVALPDIYNKQQNRTELLFKIPERLTGYEGKQQEV